MLGRIKLYFVLVASLFLVNVEASTCSSIGPNTPDMFSKVEAHSDLIFIGTVDIIENTIVELGEDGNVLRARTAKFTINSKITQFQEDRVFVHYDIKGCSCNPFFEVDQQYIVFATSKLDENGIKKYYTYTCPLIQKMKDDPEYFKYKSGTSWAVKSLWEEYYKKEDCENEKLRVF